MNDSGQQSNNSWKNLSFGLLCVIIGIAVGAGLFFYFAPQTQAPNVDTQLESIEKDRENVEEIGNTEVEIDSQPVLRADAGPELDPPADGLRQYIQEYAGFSFDYDMDWKPFKEIHRLGDSSSPELLYYEAEGSNDFFEIFDRTDKQQLDIYFDSPTARKLFHFYPNEFDVDAIIKAQMGELGDEYTRSDFEMDGYEATEIYTDTIALGNIAYQLFIQKEDGIIHFLSTYDKKTDIPELKTIQLFPPFPAQDVAMCGSPIFEEKTIEQLGEDTEITVGSCPDSPAYCLPMKNEMIETCASVEETFRFDAQLAMLRNGDFVMRAPRIVRVGDESLWGERTSAMNGDVGTCDGIMEGLTAMSGDFAVQGFVDGEQRTVGIGIGEYVDSRVDPIGEWLRPLSFGDGEVTLGVYFQRDSCAHLHMGFVGLDNRGNLMKYTVKFANGNTDDVMAVRRDWPYYAKVVNGTDLQFTTITYDNSLLHSHRRLWKVDTATRTIIEVGDWYEEVN